MREGLPEQMRERASQHHQNRLGRSFSPLEQMKEELLTTTRTDEGEAPPPAQMRAAAPPTITCTDEREPATTT